MIILCRNNKVQFLKAFRTPVGGDALPKVEKGRDTEKDGTKHASADGDVPDSHIVMANLL